MNSVANYRFESLSSIDLVGIKKFQTFDLLKTQIPKQWQEFREQLGCLLDLCPKKYGVTCACKSDGIEYLCAVKEQDLKNIPDNFDRIRIASQDYLVFSHQGQIASISDTWQSIMHVWLPELKVKMADSMPFEVYDASYDVKSASGLVEIYIPILKTASDC